MPSNSRSLFTMTKPPNPEWKLGDGASTNTAMGREWMEKDQLKWKTWDFDKTERKEAYKLLTSAIVPRPVAFVSSLSKDGVPNLAPFSYFSMVGHDPPMISVSFTLSPRKPKDTRENILDTKEFTVNIISEPFVEAASCTSVEAPAEVDEWKISGLTMAPSDLVKPARVLESAISLECQLHWAHDIYPTEESDKPSTTVVLGRVKLAHIRESVLTKDKDGVDPGKLLAVSRLGGVTFARVNEGFDIPRPSWRAMKEEFINEGSG